MVFSLEKPQPSIDIDWYPLKQKYPKKSKLLGEVTKERIQFDVESYLKIQPVTYHEYTPSYEEWIEYEYKDFMNEGEWFGSADYRSEQYSWESLLQANNVIIPDGSKLLILEKL